MSKNKQKKRYMENECKIVKNSRESEEYQKNWLIVVEQRLLKQGIR